MASKHRSPNFPAISLSRALEIAQLVWNKEKRTPLSVLDIAKLGGYTTVNGPSRQLVSAMKKYGLMESIGDLLQLSELAIKAIHGQEGDKLAARMEAGRNVPLFVALAETHGDASQDTLKSHLIVGLKFSEDGAGKCVKAFMDTKDIAKLGSVVKINEDASGIVQAGDWVQWTSQGQDQFSEPVKLVEISDDGEWGYVENSETGIPMAELTKDISPLLNIMPPVNPHYKKPSPERETRSKGPEVRFSLDGGDNEVVISVQKPITKENFEQITKLLELSETSLVARSVDENLE